jgi:methionyl-tRNA formyltransferase
MPAFAGMTIEMRPNERKPLTALILGAPNPLSMGLSWAWLRAGHRITEIWHPQKEIGGGDYRRDQMLAAKVPHMSMNGLAQRHGVRVRPISRMSKWTEAVAAARALKPDTVISLMFADRIPADFIAPFAGRIVNMHPSLLPACRGPTPLLEMLWLRTLTEHSGLTLHEVTEAFDEGPIIDQQPVAFPTDASFTQYIADQVRTGGRMLAFSLPAYLDGRIVPRPQDHRAATRCRIKRSDLVIAGSDRLERVQWLLGTIGKLYRFRLEGHPPEVRIDGLAQVLGAPTGSAANVTEGYVETDISDARIRLRRPPAVTRSPS